VLRWFRFVFPPLAKPAVPWSGELRRRALPARRPRNVFRPYQPEFFRFLNHVGYVSAQKRSRFGGCVTGLYAVLKVSHVHDRPFIVFT
jgi:hypothetical protein